MISNIGSHFEEKMGHWEKKVLDPTPKRTNIAKVKEKKTGWHTVVDLTP